MIKFLLKDVFTKALDIDQVIPKEGIGLSDEEVDIRSSLSIKAHVVRRDNFVVADTTVRADFGYLCARCLEDLHEDRIRAYHFEIEIEPGMEYVDLGEEIRQEMILANPPRILCKKDCKGMCPSCGVNLNVEDCKCKK